MIDRDKKRATRARIIEATKHPWIVELARAAATQQELGGYHRFNILIVHADSGKVIESIPTARRPEEVEQLLEEIREVASLPKGVWSNVRHESPEFGETTIQCVLDGQYLGGRPSGRHSKTAKKYRDMAKMFHNSSCLTQREFCEEMGIKRGTLQRALKFVSKNGLKDY